MPVSGLIHVPKTARSERKPVRGSFASAPIMSNPRVAKHDGNRIGISKGGLQCILLGDDNMET